MDRFLIESAFNVLKNGLKLQNNEEVLVIADDRQQYSLVEAFTIAASLLGAKVGQLVYPAVARQNEEPMGCVSKSLESVQAAVVLPKVSITHVEAIRQARKKGTRVLVCSGLDERMMKGAVNVDYGKMSALTKTFQSLFSEADQVHVTCPNGTDVTFSIRGRTTMAVDGICENEGDWNFAPAGTTATAPIEGSTEGRIVFDGSLAPMGILDEPVQLEVKNGMITRITGGREAQEFASLLASFDNPNVYNIAEMGVGTNEKAELSGKLIEDERILGAFHFGIGKSLNIGGEVDAPFHTDGIILRPSVFVDGKAVVKGGEIVI